MNPRNFVIGGGISGYIFTLYNPEYYLICDKSESKYDNPFVFIQKNKYTTQLLNHLDLYPDSIMVNIQADNSENVVNKKIAHKSKIQERYIGTDKIANISKNEQLEVYDITEVKICKEIEKRIEGKIIQGLAVEINADKLYISNGDKYDYDKIISTVHFNNFGAVMPSWNCGNDIKSESLFYSVESSDVKNSKIEYSCGRGIKKIVYNSIQKCIATEYKNNRITAKELPNSRLSGRINPPPENVTFSGRFATANSHWRIEDSIFLATEGLLLSRMIDEQRRIDKAISNKSKIKGDLRIQKLILGAHSELSELLREIPWEMHVRNSSKVKATNVLEECIDIIKYIFAILHEYEYTPREISEMFFSKSAIVWNKFIQEFYGGV
jgi:hypothetical protein